MNFSDVRLICGLPGTFEELAQDIVHAMLADQSVPQQGEDGKWAGWKSREAWGGRFERLTIGADHLDKYSQLASEVAVRLGQKGANLAIIMVARLAHFSAERQRPVDQGFDSRAVDELYNDLTRYISLLDDEDSRTHEIRAWLTSQREAWRERMRSDYAAIAHEADKRRRDAELQMHRCELSIAVALLRQELMEVRNCGPLVATRMGRVLEAAECLHDTMMPSGDDNWAFHAHLNGPFLVFLNLIAAERYVQIPDMRKQLAGMLNRIRTYAESNPARAKKHHDYVLLVEAAAQYFRVPGFKPEAMSALARLIKDQPSRVDAEVYYTWRFLHGVDIWMLEHEKFIRLLQQVIDDAPSDMRYLRAEAVRLVATTPTPPTEAGHRAVSQLSTGWTYLANRLCTTDYAMDLAPYMRRLLELLMDVIDACSSHENPNFVRWAHITGLCRYLGHVVASGIVCGDHDVLIEQVGQMKAWADATEPERHTASILVAEASLALITGNTDTEALRRLGTAMKDGSFAKMPAASAETRAVAHLLMARVAEMEGRTMDAQHLLEVINDRTASEHLRAAAARMLDRIPEIPREEP